MDVSHVTESVISLIENYGWYILICTVAGLYIYNKYLRERIQEYMKWKSEQEYSAKYHKNPDLLEKNLNAQKTYADKLQEKYNQEAELYKKKKKKRMEEKEAQKREDLLNKLEGKGGTKLGSSSKSDYNPLMGAGTSGGYRPPKKSCCKKGGGCG